MPELFDFENMPPVNTSLIEEGVEIFEESIELHERRRTVACGFGSGFIVSFALSAATEASRVIGENGDPRTGIGITALTLMGVLVSFGISGRETREAAADFQRAEELKEYLAIQPLENLYRIDSRNQPEQ
ncbi:MAG: hypothetical protein ACHQT9_05035 [Candidatus Saccharimonadales bacterium]